MVLFSKQNIRPGVKHMKFVLIGAGQRGMIYAGYAHQKGHTITAVADIDPVKREMRGQGKVHLLWLWRWPELGYCGI